MEMEKLKEKRLAVRALPLRLRRVLPLLRAHPALRDLTLCLLELALGFLLAGSGFGGFAMPFAVCLVAVSDGALRALSALLGSAVGYLYFWGFSGGLEYLAVGALVFAAVCIVGQAELSREVWFMPMIVTAMCLIVGLLFLIQARFSPLQLTLYVIRTTIAAASTLVFARAITQRSGGSVLYGLACLVSGCAAMTVAAGVTLGQIVAVAVCAAAAGTPVTVLICAVCGLALDLTAPAAGSVCASLCFAGLVASLGRLPGKLARMLVFLLGMVASVLAGGGKMPELVPAAALGCCLSLLLPDRLFLLHGAGRGLAAARQRLEQAAGALSVLQGRLQTQEPASNDMSAIFDRATDQVCNSCVLWGQCWQQRGEDTYRALCAVARPMLDRGAVSRDDFPQGFTERCCHLDGLVVAVNRELDECASRRQYRNRLRESRAALSGQYDFLQRFLRDTADTLERGDTPPAAYAPDLGIQAAGKSVGGISGDRGACFRTVDGMYYLLLCDGMGTGPEAARESADAVKTLAGLIRAGMRPRDALETLNGVYLLRGDGGFSTVDLLEASLVTAEATLYKWGAAPSYLKAGDETKKIGTASPPPGFGVGGTHKAEEYKLSLREGETLVLLSDGAGGEGTGRQIADWKEDSPKELTAAIIAQAQANGEDDMTAVALRLRPCSAWF